MRHVISNDGTEIAYQRSGSGPPLVLVHGTGTDHTYWDPVIPKLARSFTVYAVDRRGRGHSGDTQPYALQREFADVAAVVESIPGQVDVVGHSYGALCSLEAARLTTQIHKMVLYEPPMYTTSDVPDPTDILHEFNVLIDARRSEEALLMLYRIVKTPQKELNLLRSLPNWQARILAAHTIPREVMSVEIYSFDRNRFRDLKIPIRFLLGGESLSVYKEATQTLHASLPNSRIVILPEQQHEAVVTAPDLFLREVTGFLLQSS
jgi:pimeloyl-ACP methyl ester carboxylesterase